MELRDYWRVFSRRWWLVLAVALAAAAGSYLYSKLETPIYRSVVKLSVTPFRPDAGQTIAAQNLLRQYKEQVSTDRQLELVNERLKLDLPLGELRAKIKASAVMEDLIIAIQVDDTDPGRAQTIAFALADELEQQQWGRMQLVDPRDRIDVLMLDRPQAGVKVRPNTRANTMAAALLGLLLGAALIFLLEYLDDTLKTAEDVERYGRLTVLGAIPTTPAGER